MLVNTPILKLTLYAGVDIWKRLNIRYESMFAVMLVPVLSRHKGLPDVILHRKEHAFNPAVGMLHLKYLKVMFLNMAHNASYFTVA